MTASTIAHPDHDVLEAEFKDVVDAFDLDIRITVQPDPSRPEAHFSIWYSCASGVCWTVTSLQTCC